MLDNNLFNSLSILNEDQLKSASKDQLVSLFNQMNSIKQNMEKQLLDLRVQIETKQNEYKKLSDEIQEKFQTSSIEELESLRQIKIGELAKLGENLKAKRDNYSGGENDGS